jgi:hypothetical protein
MTSDARLQTAIQSVLNPDTGTLDTDIKIVIVGKQEGSRPGSVRERRFTFTLTGDDARKFISDPSYEFLGELYGVGEDFFLFDEINEDGIVVQSVNIYPERGEQS